MIPYSQNPLGTRSKAFITRWNVSASETIYLPLVSAGTYNMLVEWGDGSSETINTYTSNTHTYTNTGIYDIKISGACSHWSFGSVTTSRDNVIAVLNWGDVGIVDLSFGFSTCSNLMKLAPYAPNIPSFYWTFANCPLLKNIPDKLFNLCHSTTTFTTVFSGSGLESIPDGLFRRCVMAIYFNYSFRDNDIVAIPSGIFDNNPRVANFKSCFSGNPLTGSSGELWLNPSGSGDYTLVPPNYDSGVPDGQDCYAGCTGLSDYATIPTYWK